MCYLSLAKELKVYFTGDLARYLPNGMIQIDGRDDDQIKIRGVRANKNEIIAAIKNLTGVNDCYVLDDKISGETTITAYVDVENEKVVPSIRQELIHVLPMAMIPSQFIPVPHMPVTASGKVDRRKLRGYGWLYQAVKH